MDFHLALMGLKIYSSLFQYFWGQRVRSGITQSNLSQTEEKIEAHTWFWPYYVAWVYAEGIATYVFKYLARSTEELCSKLRSLTVGTEL